MAQSSNTKADGQDGYRGAGAGPAVGPARPLQGRSALLTGSSGGLGYTMAQALAQAGCSVMLNGLEDKAEAEPKRAALAASAGVSVHYHRADLGTAAGVEALARAAQDAFGGVDILVNNAVIRHFAPIVDLDPAAWDAALAVNLSAPFHAARLLLPEMRARNYGRIFNMISVYGLRATRDRVGYVTTKAALIGLTRSIALENLDFDVTSHSICPGSVLTPGTEGRIEQMMLERGIDRAAAERTFLEGKQPSGRFVSAGSVSDLLIFLCGPAARDMTGSILPVEGGWLAS